MSDKSSKFAPCFSYQGQVDLSQVFGAKLQDDIEIEPDDIEAIPNPVQSLPVKRKPQPIPASTKRAKQQTSQKEDHPSSQTLLCLSDDSDDDLISLDSIAVETAVESHSLDQTNAISLAQALALSARDKRSSRRHVAAEAKKPLQACSLSNIDEDNDDDECEVLMSRSSRVNSPPITVHIRSATETTSIKVNLNESLSAVFTAYCESRAIECTNAKFKCDGIELDWSKRPDDYALRENETIIMQLRDSVPHVRSPSTADTPQTSQQSYSEDQEDSQASNKTTVTLVLRDKSQSTKFRIATTDPLKKLLDGYCKKFAVDEALVKLVFDGETLKMNVTPESLDMEDEDIIDVQLLGQPAPTKAPALAPPIPVPALSPPTAPVAGNPSQQSQTRTTRSSSKAPAPTPPASSNPLSTPALVPTNADDQEMMVLILRRGSTVAEATFNKNKLLKVLANDYCALFGLNPKQVTFKYAGKPMRKNSTPLACSMKNGDVIDVTVKDK